MTNLPSLKDIRADKRQRDDELRAAERRNAARARVDLAKQIQNEAIAEKKRQKAVAHLRAQDLQNIKLKPGLGSIGNGTTVRIDKASGHGHLSMMHRQQPLIWTFPMLAAGARFSRDYDRAKFPGMMAMGLEPKVDTSGIRDPLTGATIDAAKRLEQLHRRIGEDCYGILVLVCGIGLTFTDLHKQGIGDKRVLSDLLRTALRRADAFYSGSSNIPQSDFLERASGLLDGMKSGPRITPINPL